MTLSTTARTDLPAIRCARCDKPVDEIWTTYDPWTRVTRFVVRCHGQRDTCELTDLDMLAIIGRGASIVNAIAFRELMKLPEK
jgi:hypothetical protein